MVASEVPNFTLTNQEGEEVKFYEALDNTSKGMIIFVYPKANTPGCTKQACGFRDHYEEIKGLGYDVLGISKDKQAAQATWKKNKKLPYDLLCDETGETLKELGCIAGNTTSRSVFVVDKESKAFVLERVKISPEESVSAAIKAITGGDVVSVSDSSDKSASEGSEHEVDEEEKVGETKAAKPKAKAKAKAKPGRPPMEKKAVDEEGKKTLPTRRATTKRSASVDVAAAEKKPTAAAGRAAPTGKKGSQKRSEPSGGADEADGSPKGAKRLRKDAAAGAASSSASEEESSVGAAAVPTPTAAAGSKQPKGSAANSTREAASKEKGTSAKEAKDEANAESGTAAGATTAVRALPKPHFTYSNTSSSPISFPTSSLTYCHQHQLGIFFHGHFGGNISISFHYHTR